MAIPTVTSVQPNTGSTRGNNVIRIIGSNFRPPNSPEPIGYQGGEQQKTVSVKFSGVESEWAYYASAGLILAKVPAWTGAYDLTFPLAIDVRVANLNDLGAEITGENATLIGGYAISRPSLVSESYLQRVIRELIKIYRRHLLANTHHITSRDYSANPSSQETLKASAPLVQLVGPFIVLNRFYTLNREEPEDDSGGGVNGMMRREVPVVCDVRFEVRAYATSDRHLAGLMQGLLLLHRDIKYLKVPVNPSDLTQGTKDYELQLIWDRFPECDTDPNVSDLMSMSAAIRVRGIHLDENLGTMVERGWKIFSNDGDPVVEY